MRAVFLSVAASVAFLPVLVVRADSLRAALADPLTWLYDDSGMSDVQPISELDVPRNGVADVNVLVCGLERGRTMRLSCSQDGAEWFRLVAVQVVTNTGVGGCIEIPSDINPFVSRRAPFRIYDAMKPVVGGRTVPASETCVLRFRLRKLDWSGRRTVVLSLEQGGSAEKLLLSVNVHPVDVVKAGRASFKYTNWMNWESMADCHGLPRWSDAHREMIRRYVRLAVYGRQNMVLLPRWVKDENGVQVPDEDRYRSFVGLLEQEGIVFFEGPHFCHFSTGHWTAPAFTPNGCDSVSTSPAGERALAATASAFATMIERNGWRTRWFQHVADEPNDYNFAEYNRTCAIVRKNMPGIRLIDAIDLPDFDPMQTNARPTFAGSLDVYCPKNYRYELAKSDYESMRIRPGDAMWCYTCCFPGGKWMNRLLDGDLIRPLLLPWGCFRHRLNGYLHWGFNQFDRTNDPLLVGRTAEVKADLGLPPGDRNIAYAGTDGPWPSVRLEAMRQGFEDLELLRLLASQDAPSADRLVGRIVRGFQDYDSDVAAYRVARRDLLKAAAEAMIAKKNEGREHE